VNAVMKIGIPEIRGIFGLSQEILVFQKDFTV
jgi:hypothetical protein